MKPLNKLIIDWNRERGLLDNFDPGLEIRMLSEEAKEFYMAETFEHRLAEYADFLFVSIGTTAKYNCQTDMSPTFFSTGVERFAELDKWMQGINKEMYDLLQMEATCIEDLAKDLSFPQLILVALTVVVENNQLKGKKTVNGKVIKAEVQDAPEDIIGGIIYEC